MFGRDLKSNVRAAGPLYVVLAIILFIVVVVVFLLQPAYFIAIVAMVIGAGVALAGRGNPATLIIGGILLVGGLVLAILAAVSGSLHGFAIVYPTHSLLAPSTVLTSLRWG